MDVDEPAVGSAQWMHTFQRRIRSLCDECVADTGAQGGGVALVSRHGVRDVVYATDPTAETLERIQLDLGEGPCVDVATAQIPVLVEDLQDRREGVTARWPIFLGQARGLGVRAMFAFPIRLGAVPLGTLELYRNVPGPLGDEQLTTALKAVDAMGMSVIGIEPSNGDGVAPGDMGAQVHQAAGMLMVQLGRSIDEAYSHLRAIAFLDGVTVREVAQDVVEGRRRFNKEQQ